PFCLEPVELRRPAAWRPGRGTMREQRRCLRSAAARCQSRTSPVCVCPLSRRGSRVFLWTTLQTRIGFPRPPNELVRVGEVRWLQDCAYDSFSDAGTTSIWQTLCEVVGGKKEIYRSRSAPLGISTLMCYWSRPDENWYALDTRRTLVYKMAFHPEQPIPVHAIPFNKLVNVKLSSHRWSHDRSDSVWFCLRLHRSVPLGAQSLPFIRNRSELALCVHRAASVARSLR
ncbi:unnamed protein product, partial [Prorocentrum cordatum]